MATNTFPPIALIDLNAIDVFSGMLLAFALCATLAIFSRYRNTSATSNESHPRTMILLGVVVSLIMAIIGNSLARAFGAIGALSLIRFRTAVKEPQDLAQLFMSISVGMACGSGYFKIAIGAAALFAIFIFLIDYLPLSNPVKKIYLIKLSFPTKNDFEQQLIEILQESSTNIKILTRENLVSENLQQLLIEINTQEELSEEQLFSKLLEVDSSIKATLMIS